MFATTIRFTLPPETDWEALRQFLVQRAFEVDRGLPGLRAKAQVLSPERGEFGGNYVWETQDDAEAFLRSDVYGAVVARFGEPRLERAEVCAYVEDGDLYFPAGGPRRDASAREAAQPGA